MLQDEHFVEILENEILWNHRKSFYSLFVTEPGKLGFSLGPSLGLA
jgi:hypothetical protein